MEDEEVEDDVMDEFDEGDDNEVLYWDT